jgi:lipopolysaccharide transport system permease protein
VSSGTVSLVTYRDIVTKTYFPREIVPLAQVCSRLIDFFVAAALFALLMAYYGIGLGPWSLMAPVFLLLLVMFTVGVTLLTSALNVFYRDVNPVVQISLQLWLYLTPVAYPLSAVPSRFRPLFVLNPLSAIVEGFRSSIVFGQAPDWTLSGAATLLIVAVLATAFVTFKRMDKYFADVI